jgi:hypothetical protein
VTLPRRDSSKFYKPFLSISNALECFRTGYLLFETVSHVVLWVTDPSSGHDPTSIMTQPIMTQKNKLGHDRDPGRDKVPEY